VDEDSACPVELLLLLLLLLTALVGSSTTNGGQLMVILTLGQNLLIPLVSNNCPFIVLPVAELYIFLTVELMKIPGKCGSMIDTLAPFHVQITFSGRAPFVSVIVGNRYSRSAPAGALKLSTNMGFAEFCPSSVMGLSSGIKYCPRAVVIQYTPGVKVTGP
jgi:hypothetical protein